MIRWPVIVRYARCGEPKQSWSSFVIAGELIDIERVTISSERGRWKSTHQGNSLASYSNPSTALARGRDGQPPDLLYNGILAPAPPERNPQNDPWDTPAAAMWRSFSPRATMR